jgi:hypothetical protein
LRRYPAQDAAVSIRELIAGESSKKEASQQDPYYQYLMSMANRNSPQKEDPHKGFYVAADELRNRLLVKANRQELKQIYNLLKELGEVPDDRSDGVAMRILDATEGDVLERLQKVWAQTGGNPLLINGSANPAANQDKEEDGKKAGQPVKDRGVQATPPMKTPSIFARFASQENSQPADAPASAEIKAGRARSDPAN